MNNYVPLEEVSLEGFQIVKSEMFLHFTQKKDPTCTIWPHRINFNKQSLMKLNNCEYVRIEVNPITKCLLVIPVPSTDKNSIRWVKGKKEICTRLLESRAFGSEIYKTWGFDEDYNYRSAGKLVSSQNKVMLLFDFKEAEVWKSRRAEKTTL